MKKEDVYKLIIFVVGLLALPLLIVASDDWIVLDHGNGTTYSADNHTLTLTGTLFTGNETYLNATIDARAAGGGGNITGNGFANRFAYFSSATDLTYSYIQYALAYGIWPAVRINASSTEYTDYYYTGIRSIGGSGYTIRSDGQFGIIGNQLELYYPVNIYGSADYVEVLDDTAQYPYYNNTYSLGKGDKVFGGAYIKHINTSCVNFTDGSQQCTAAVDTTGGNASIQNFTTSKRHAYLANASVLTESTYVSENDTALILGEAKLIEGRTDYITSSSVYIISSNATYLSYYLSSGGTYPLLMQISNTTINTYDDLVVYGNSLNTNPFLAVRASGTSTDATYVAKDSFNRWKWGMRGSDDRFCFSNASGTSSTDQNLSTESCMIEASRGNLYLGRSNLQINTTFNLTMDGTFNNANVTQIKHLQVSNTTNTMLDFCNTNGGTCNISNTRVTANTAIFCNVQNDTSATPDPAAISARQPGSSYNVSVTDVTMSHRVACMLIEPYAG